MAGQRHSWEQFMYPAPKYACFAGYIYPKPLNILLRGIVMTGCGQLVNPFHKPSAS